MVIKEMEGRRTKWKGRRRTERDGWKEIGRKEREADR